MNLQPEIQDGQYDGFHLLPHPTDDNLVNFSFFKLKENVIDSPTIGGTEIGDMYRVLFFKQDGKDIKLDWVFEAIFADPLTYAENLIGMGVYGTFVKKTKESETWWNNYLTETLKQLNITDVNLEIKND